LGEKKMTVKLRPSAKQQQLECLREIHPLHVHLEKATQKLDELQKRVDELRKTIAINPEAGKLPAFQHVFQEYETAAIGENAARLEFCQRVTEFIFVLKGTKDRLARELHPNQEGQQAFIAEIDAALTFAADAEPGSSDEESAPVTQTMVDRPNNESPPKKPRYNPLV